MSGPVSPPLATTESGTSTIVRPTNTLEFNGADFTVTGSGSKATISIDSTGTGAALSDGQIGFGSSANLLTGSSLLTYDDTAGSELVTIKGSGTSTLLKLESTEAGGAVSPILDLFRNSASPATGDDLGQILFSGNDSAGAKQNYFQIKGEIRDKTSGSDDGELIFIGPSNSTDIEFVRMSKTVGVVVNEGGGGIVDFRVETSNNNAILCSDAGNDNLGIGTSSPNSDALLHITDNGTKAATVRIESTDTDAGVGPVFELLRNPGEAVQVNDDLGKIEFQGPGGDVSGTPKSYAQIITEAQGASSGAEHARVMFKGLVSGSMKEFMRYSAFSTGGLMEINAFSQDIDFKIEGDSTGRINFFSDASQDNVGIGALPSSDVEALHVTGTGTGTLVRFESTDTGASEAPTLELKRNSASPATGDDIGTIDFIGEDDGDNATTYAQISAEIADETGGTEDGWLRFGASFAGTLQPNMMTIKGNVPEVVINEGSGDIDFRVESNGNANMLKVDGGLNLVGISAAPTSGGATLQIPDNTISHYCNVNSIRSDAVGIMVMVNDDNQGQMWVHESASAHTIQLVEGGVKGQHFQFMSTDGNITIDPQGTDTLNGGTASLTRSTNYEIYDVFCYDTGKWALSNPA